MVRKLLGYAILFLLGLGCASPKNGGRSSVNSPKPWETVAEQAVAALLRGDGAAFSQLAHFRLARDLRQFIAQSISANPESSVSRKTLVALGVSSADEVMKLNNDEFLEKAVNSPFFNNAGSPRRQLKGGPVRVLRSYYLDGVYQVIIQGEGGESAGTNAVIVYVSRQNLDFKYYGDPSLYSITTVPKEVPVRDMAIDAAEKGNYRVLDAKEPKHEAKGWMVVMMRQHQSSTEAEMIKVFVSDDLKTVKLKPFFTGSVSDDLSRSKPPRRPFR